LFFLGGWSVWLDYDVATANDFTMWTVPGIHWQIVRRVRDRGRRSPDRADRSSPTAAFPARRSSRSRR